MSKTYLIQESTLSGMADEIRVLHGAQDEMSTGQMIAELERANNAKDEQAELIATIKSTLAEKAIGVTLPELSSPGYASDLAQGKQLIDANGNIVYGNVRVVVENAYLEGGRNELACEDNYIIPISFTVSDSVLIRANTTFHAANIFSDELGNAKPEDVLSGVVFSSHSGLKAVGTLKVQTYYYGTDEPSADLGVNGDLYFVMG